jgi:MATE family multidrug resistance protein
VGTLLMMGLCVPFMAVLGFSEELLLLIGQEPGLAADAGGFCRGLVAGVPPFVAFTCLSKHLQAQRILRPAAYIALVANVANCAANWLLIHRLGLGVRGAPLATSLCRWVQLGLLGAYFAGARERLRPTLPGLRVDCAGLPAAARDFFRLGAPGALMLGLESWSFDVTSIFAGYLGEAALGAHAIMLNVIALTFVAFPLALSIAASIEVGHALGAGAAARARRASHLTLGLTLAVMTALAALKLALRGALGRAFTDDEAVVGRVARLVPIAALFQISDGVQAAVAGVMRGMGRQTLVAALNLIGFWAIGVPAGAALTFGARLGVAGLWWGLLAGLTAVATIGTLALLRTDWEAEACRALVRVSVKTAGGGITSSTEGEEVCGTQLRQSSPMVSVEHKSGPHRPDVDGGNDNEASRAADEGVRVPHQV